MAKRKPAPSGLVIPPVPPELDDPIRALVRSASLLEAIVVAMASGKSFGDLAADGLENMELASKAIEAWRQHYGIALGGGDVPPKRRKK